MPSQPATGTIRENPRDGLKYVWIPPGRFRMGCSASDTECYDDEKPARDVEITRGFWIGQTEVTQKAYQKVKGTNPSKFKGSTLPVEHIELDGRKRVLRIRGNAAADRGRVGVCGAWRKHGGSLRGIGERGMVRRKQRQQDSSGGAETTERVRSLRRAGKCLGVGVGLV